MHTTRIAAGLSVLGAFAPALATTPDEVRALVAEMLDDAASRSSLIEGGPAAGHDGKNFFLGDAAGAFRLTLRGQIQFRYFVSLRDESDGNNDGVTQRDVETGFQTRRTKLDMQGHVFSPDLTFRVQGAHSRSTGDLILEDAYVQHRFSKQWSVTLGQFKAPFTREELYGSTVLTSVEHTSVNEVFTVEYVQGVQVLWTGEDARVFGSFNDGAASRNSDLGTLRRAPASGILAGANRGESDFGVTARAEFKHGADWSRFRDNSSTEGSEPAWLLGIAGHVEGGDNADPSFAGGRYLEARAAIDAGYEGDGWNALLWGVYSWIDVHDTPAAGDIRRDDFGLVAQVAAYIPGTQWEPFVQHAVLFPDADRTGGGGTRATNALTLGTNYYMHGHAAKFTADVVWRIDDQDVLLGRSTSSGYLGDDDPGEVTLRFQWQLLF
jgi:hypothetical protein